MMNDLETRIITEAKRYNPGSFVRVVYKTTAQLTKDGKCNCKEITKHVETTTRFGVCYKNINGIIPSENKRNTMHYEVDKYLLRNNTSNQAYLVIYPIKSGSNYKATYIAKYEDGTTEVLNESKVNQYVRFNMNTNKPKYQTIKVENIISIGGKHIG